MEKGFCLFLRPSSLLFSPISKYFAWNFLVTFCHLSGSSSSLVVMKLTSIMSFVKSFEFISPRRLWGPWGQNCLSFIWVPSLANSSWHMENIHQMLTELTKFPSPSCTFYLESLKQPIKNSIWILLSWSFFMLALHLKKWA